jgi:hypothetical protein
MTGTECDEAAGAAVGLNPDIAVRESTQPKILQRCVATVKVELPIFAGDGYAGLSEVMRYYIGGLLNTVRFVGASFVNRRITDIADEHEGRRLGERI